MIYNYERVLRQVTYSNKKPAYYLNRQFRITCSELNGRFVSNEYIQTVSPNPKKFGISMKKGFIVHSPWYLPPSELVDFT